MGGVRVGAIALVNIRSKLLGQERYIGLIQHVFRFRVNGWNEDGHHRRRNAKRDEPVQDGRRINQIQVFAAIVDVQRRKLLSHELPRRIVNKERPCLVEVSAL